MSLLALGWTLLGFVEIANAATGASERWTPFGPDVSSVRALAFTPSGTLYAGTTERGAFRTGIGASGGARWNALGWTDQVSYIYELAIDPEDPRRIYARTSVGLFLSRNGGTTWEATGYSRPLATYYAVAVAPSDADRVYALSPSRLEWSRDRGATWQQTEFYPSRNAAVLRVDPRDPDILYVALSFDGSFLKSTDAGVTWVAGVAKNGGNMPPYVLSLALDPRNPDVQYIGTRGDGIWKSTDAGETWEPVLPGTSLAVSVPAIAIDPAQPRRIYAGLVRIRDQASPIGEVWRSEDAGATWSRMFSSNATLFALAIDPTNPSTVYAGFERKGVLRSTNRGATWHPARTGLQAYTAHDVTADPQEPGSVWIAAPEVSTYFEGQGGWYTYPGLYHTPDGGKRWVASDRGIANPTFPLRVVFDPVRPERLWTFDGSYAFRSVDGGATWQDVSLPLLILHFHGSELAIDPTDPDRMYFAGFTSVLDGDSRNDIPTVLRSLDGGETWTKLEGDFEGERSSNRSMYGLTLHPDRPATVYAGGSSGFFRSRNGGDRWAKLGAGLGCYVYGSIVVDPFASNTLYAVTCDDNPIYKSTDFGATWKPTPLAADTFSFSELVADPHRPGTLYAAGRTGVFVTDNRGVSWRPLNTGLPPGAWVLSLEADPHVPGRIYAGLRGGGVYVIDRRRTSR